MKWIVDESRKEQVQSEGMIKEVQILYHGGGVASAALMCVSWKIKQHMF